MNHENKSLKNKLSAGIRSAKDGTPILPEGVTVFFMSEVLKKPALLKSGINIGKIKDIAVKINEGHYPEATHIVVSRPWGHPDLLIPWSKVSDISERQAVVDISENLENFAAAPGGADDLILVNEKIMDKKIIDMEDREVEVVYDIQLVSAEGKLYLTHVDASQSGLLRRIKLGFLNKLLYGKKESPDLMPWNYVHVPADLGRLKGQVRLSVQKEKLKDIHPADLADIIEELGHEERMEIFNGLDTEKAADTLEEIEPRVQRQLIKSIRRERIGEIFKSMTSAQLADLFSILPNEESNRFIETLDSEKARKVRTILSQREETVASLVSRTYVALPGEITVAEALARYRREAIDRAVIMYTYVVGEDDTLLGVLDVRELIQADPVALLKDVMVKNPVTVEPDDAKDDVIALFKKYYFRALPVVDAQDRLIGIIRLKDIFIGQKSPVSET